LALAPPRRSRLNKAAEINFLNKKKWVFERGGLPQLYSGPPSQRTRPNREGPLLSGDPPGRGNRHPREKKGGGKHCDFKGISFDPPLTGP